MSQNYSKEGHYYAAAGQPPTAGMLINRSGQPIPGGGAFTAMVSPEMKQMAYSMPVRHQMAPMGQNFRAPMINHYNHQPRPPFQVAAGPADFMPPGYPHPTAVPFTRIPQPLVSYYQPTLNQHHLFSQAIYHHQQLAAAAPRPINPGPHPNQMQPQQQQQNINPAPPAPNMVAATPSPAPAEIAVMPTPNTAIPPPVAPVQNVVAQPPPQPLEKRPRQALKIVNPDTGVALNLESIKPATKPQNPIDDIPPAPLIFPETMIPPGTSGMPAALYGNPKIWVPPPQPQTPVVSAITDGPAVIPKQSTQKKPKPSPLVEKDEEELEEEEEEEEDQEASSTTTGTEDEIIDVVNVTADTITEAPPPLVSSSIIETQELQEETEQIEIKPEDDLSITDKLEKLQITEEPEEEEPEAQEITEKQEIEETIKESIVEVSTKDEPDRAQPVEIVSSPILPVPPSAPVIIEKSECEKVLEKYGAQLPNLFPNSTIRKDPNPIQTPPNPVVEEITAANKEQTSDTKSSNKPKIDYIAGQWSPANVSGKKFYTAEQLLELGRNIKLHQKLSIPINPSIQNSLMPQQQFSIEQILKLTHHNRGGAGGGGHGGPGNYPLKRLSQQLGGGKQMHQHMNNKMMMMQHQKMQQQEQLKMIQMNFMEEVKLRETENAWRPKHLQKQDKMTEDEKELRAMTEPFRAALNKITPENFSKLVQDVKNITITKESHLKAWISIMFEKAVAEPVFSVTYAQMCKELATMKPLDAENNTKVQFKFVLITQCQTEFEASNQPKCLDYRNELLKNEPDPVKRDQLKEQFEEEDYRERKRAVGTCRFIGELFKIDLLIPKIMNNCVASLLDPIRMDEERLECCCKLLSTVGKKMEAMEKDCLDKPFERLHELLGKKSPIKISSRIRFMIQDVIDLRRSRWQPRRTDVNPKTLNQIQREVETEQRNILILNNYGGGGGNQNQRNNKYDRRMNQMNYRPKEVNFDSKKMDFSRLSGNNMETETKLGQASFFKQWNAPSGGSSKNQYDDDGGGNGKNMPVMNMMPSFGNKDRGGGGDRDRGKDRYDRNDRRITGDSKDSNRYDQQQQQQHYNSNRYNNHRGMNSRDNSMTKNGSRGPPPPGLSLGGQNMPSSASSSMLSYQSTSSSSRGSDYGQVMQQQQQHQHQRRHPVVECEEPSNSEREALIKEIRRIFFDYFKLRDRGEAVKDLHGIRRGHRWAALFEEAVYLLEQKQDERKAFTDLCMVYVKAGESTLTVDELVKIFTGLVDIAIDSQVDIPKVWEYVAEYMSLFLHDRIIRLSDLVGIADSSIKNELGHEFIGSILTVLSRNYDTKFALDLWCQSGMNLDTFMPYFNQTRVNEFAQKHSVLSTLHGGSSQKPNWDVAEHSIEDCLRKESNETRVRQYIDTWQSKTTPDDPNFIRAFTTACINYAIEYRQNLDENKLTYVGRILKDYLGKREDCELQALYAIHRVVNKLEYPPGLLQNVFAQLYDNHIISGRAFISWRESPIEAVNKGVAIKSLNTFFIHVSEEALEDSSCDEDN